MEQKNKNIKFLVIAVLISLLIAVGLTYAYFAVGYTNDADINTKANVVKQTDSFTTSGEAELELNVTNAVMKNDEGKDDYSVFQTDSDTFTVSLTAGSDKAICTYDLAISSEGDPYTKSSSVGNYFEYTIEGSAGNQSFKQINIDTAMNSTITAGESDESGTQVTSGIIGHYRISDKYDEGSTQTPTTQTWTITSKFYNLAKNQNDQLNKNFEHHVKVVNVSCENHEIPTKITPTIVGTGTLDDIGTEIAIGDEHFYVISSDDTSVTMLAKYNLLVEKEYNNSSPFETVTEYTSSSEGYNLQSSEARGWVSDLSTSKGPIKYSANKYWNNNGLKPEYGVSYPAYVYDDYTPTKGYIDEYKNLLDLKYDVSIEEARIIKYEELISLGCTDTCKTNTINNNNRQWVYSTSYWTGTAATNEYIYGVYAHGVLSKNNYNVSKSYGIRPVITILKSEF